MDIKKPQFKEINISLPFVNICDDVSNLNNIDGITKNIYALKNTEISVDELIRRERLEEINKIEQDLIDINEIMHSLNEFVLEQGIILDDVEENIDQTDIHVNTGVTELEIADKHHTNTKRKNIVVIGGATVGGALAGGVGSIFGIIPGLVGGSVGSGTGAVAGYFI